MKKRYSREYLIEVLQDYARKNGVPPTKKQLNKDSSMPSDMAYRKEFGSWGNALLASGFEIPKPNPSEQCKKAVSRVKKGKVGNLSPVWKGGRYISFGYVLVWNPVKQKYEREHRKIMEQHLGRELLPSEDVHHINGDKQDNRIENLVVLSKSEHTTIHEEMGHHNQNKRKTSTCLFPNCTSLTSSKYGLCNKHYRLQWSRLKSGLIDNLTDFREIPRIHTDETKNKLSLFAKKQPRCNGRFSMEGGAE